MGHEILASLFSISRNMALILHVMCYFFLTQVDRHFSRKLTGVFHASCQAFFTQVDSQLVLPRTKEFRFQASDQRTPHNVSDLIQGVQNKFSKQEIEFSKQDMELFLPLPGL